MHGLETGTEWPESVAAAPRVRSQRTPRGATRQRDRVEDVCQLCDAGTHLVSPWAAGPALAGSTLTLKHARHTQHNEPQNTHPPRLQGSSCQWKCTPIARHSVDLPRYTQGPGTCHAPPQRSKQPHHRKQRRLVIVLSEQRRTQHREPRTEKQRQQDKSEGILFG